MAPHLAHRRFAGRLLSRWEKFHFRTLAGNPGMLFDPVRPQEHPVGMNTREDSPTRRKRQREQTPVQRALGLLVRREHSRKELGRKLIARGVDADEAAAAVARLAEDGWQDDARFAEALVRNRTGGGYGPLHIRAELATHGLDSERIEAAMAIFEGDWAELARELVRRRFGPDGPQDLAQRRKAADMLARRGFDGGCIRSATRYDPED